MSFRTLVRPEVLFLLGTLQAMLPYAIWFFRGPNPSYDYVPTLMPPALWALGLAGFYLGTRLVPGHAVGQRHCLDSLRLDRLMWCLIGICVLIVPQILSLILLFGGIPLLAFLDGSMDVVEVNGLLETSSLGQMALLSMSLCTLNACVTLSALSLSRLTNRAPLVALITLALIVEIFGYTAGGKRQGLFMAMFFAFCGFSLYSNDPAGVVLRALGLASAPLRKVSYIGLAVVALGFFEILGFVRAEQEHELGVQEALRYLELPMINLEYQCELAGYGPNTFEPFAVFRFLLPNRLALVFGDTFRDIDFPPRLEPTSPAGFFGELHWRLGWLGVIVGALVAGMISQYCYSRSRRSLFLFLCYCQIAWTLFSCHSYNHFLNIVFLPLPALCYLALSAVVRARRRLVRGTCAQRSPLNAAV